MTLRLRRGGTGAGAPAPTIYGPTAGSQAVRNAASPQEVTVFSGTPGTDFTQLNPVNSQATNQAAINADTTKKVWFPKGTYAVSGSAYTFKTDGTEYRWESVACTTSVTSPRTSANTAVMNGPGNVTGSFDAASLTGSTFKGGLWQNFTSGIVGFAGAVLEDVEVTNLFNIGFGFLASNTRATRVWAHHNGKYGCNAVPPTLPAVISNVTFEYCRINNNNERQLDTLVDAGSCKFLFVHGMTLQNSWFHDNYGFGPWWDTACTDVMCQENVVEDNRDGGFFYEDCQGGTTFRHNAALRNGDTFATNGGRANLQFSSCNGPESRAGTQGSFDYIQCEKNLIDGSGAQTSIWMHNAHASLCKNIYVDDNDIWLRTSGAARVGGSNVGGQFVGQNLLWTANKYHVDSLSTLKWHWDTTQFTPKSWATWQALGFDTAGTRTVI